MSDDGWFSALCGAAPARCPHRMLARCPKCDTEIYGPAVYAFAHGRATCSCGHTPDPTPKGRQP